MHSVKSVTPNSQWVKENSYPLILHFYQRKGSLKNLNSVIIYSPLARAPTSDGVHANTFSLKKGVNYG